MSELGLRRRADKAVEVYGWMLTAGRTPNIFHYNALVRLFE